MRKRLGLALCMAASMVSWIPVAQAQNAPSAPPPDDPAPVSSSLLPGEIGGHDGAAVRLVIGWKETSTPHHGSRIVFELDDGWAQAGRMAAKLCERRRLAAGHFSGHKPSGALELLCSGQGAIWRDATAQEIALTPWAFTDVNKVSWAQANRAAERLCAAAGQGFAGGHFNGHQLDGKYGLFCYRDGAQWFDATDADLAATGFGFPTPRLDDVMWSQAMRAATIFCQARGFDGGFMNGHQLPDKYGVVCQK